MCIRVTASCPGWSRFCCLSLKGGCQGPAWCRSPSPASGCSRGCFPLSQGGRSYGYIWLAFPMGGCFLQGLGWASGKSTCVCKEQRPLLLTPVNREERLQGNHTGSSGNWNKRQYQDPRFFSTAQGPPSPRDLWSGYVSICLLLFPSPLELLLPIPTTLSPSWSHPGSHTAIY